MLEIIILIFLTREIGKLAVKKGVRPGTWKIYMILGWLVSEVIGIIFGVLIFGQNNLISVFLVGLTFAVTSYFITDAQLRKLPDHDVNNDIHHFGNRQ